MAAAQREPEVDPVEAKRLRKKAKRLAKAAAEQPEQPDPAEVDETGDYAEAKRLRKAAKKAAKEAAAADAETPRLRKAAKKAPAEDAEGDDEGVPVAKAKPEVAPAGESEPLDEAAAEAKRVKAEKRARLRANKAKAAGVELHTPKKTKRDAQDEDDEAPKGKKSKTKGSSKEVEHKFGDDFKVFVRGLPWSVDEPALQKHFENCGVIEDLKMPKTASGMSRGVGFIKFATQEGFDAALKLDDTELGGRKMYVAKIEKREGKGQGKEAVSLPKVVSNELTAFIRGLPFSTEEAQLRKDFEECGAIEKITLPMNAEGRPKGICFMKFLDAGGLEAALKFDDTEYAGRTIHVHKAEDGKGGKGKDGKGKDGKGKGKDGKSKGKDSKGKSKGKDSKGKGSKGPSDVTALDDSDSE